MTEEEIREHIKNITIVTLDAFEHELKKAELQNGNINPNILHDSVLSVSSSLFISMIASFTVADVKLYRKIVGEMLRELVDECSKSLVVMEKRDEATAGTMQ